MVTTTSPFKRTRTFLLPWPLRLLRNLPSRCLFLLFLLAALWPARVQAHSGAVAIAVPVAGITIDGDFSDWPEGMRRYPILHREDGIHLKDAEDFQGSFRVGYNAQENALYVAVEVVDESAVIDTTAGVRWRGAQDGCEVYIEPGHREEDTPLAYVIWGNTRKVFGTGMLEEVKVEVQREAHRHRYEWRVDMGRVHEGQGHLRPRMVVGFDVALWDKDADGSASWMTWGGGPKRHEHSGDLGDLMLVGQEEELGAIQGQVCWAETREGVAHAQVRVQSLADERLATQAVADEKGEWSAQVPVGQYRVEVNWPGRGEREKKVVEVKTGSTVQVELSALVPSGERVPAGPGKGYWQTLGVVDGLVNQTVRALLQDRQGNLWFGVEGGVSRYDGRQFTSFTERDGLAGGWVLAVAEDQEGNLWFGTENGVSRYDGKEIKNFTTTDGLVNPTVTSILADRKGRLWFGTGRRETGGGGVSRYDGQSFTAFTMADNWVVSIAEDRAGNLWFGTTGGASRYDGKEFVTFTTADGLASNDVLAIVADRAGNLWFGTAAGVSRYDGKEFVTFTTADGLANNDVWAMVADRAGNLWFGTAAGVSRYDGQQWITITTKDGLTHDNVGAILEDRDGQLWFGTGRFGTGGGVSRYSGEQLRTFTTADGLGHNKVNSILEDRGGHLWFKTGKDADWGMSRYNGQDFVRFTPADGLGRVSDGLDDLVEDRAGNLWFGSTRYNGQYFTTFTAAEGLESDPWRLKEDRQGTLWASLKEGVRRYASGRFLAFTALDSLREDGVRLLLEDRQGNLWFGTWDGGAIRYDGKQATAFTMKDGLGDNSISTLFEDQQGKIWIGTWEGGVSCYDGKELSTWTKKEGLAGNWVNAITQDREGRLLIATMGGGVSLFDGRVMQSLNSKDGLADDRVWDLHQDRKGAIWIATEAGVTRYLPLRTPPLIYIRDVVADHRYGPVQQLRLSSSQKLLAFEFQGLSFKTRLGQMAYVYKLEGHDPDWRVTRENRVEYTDLPVGNYTFQVKAVDRDLNYSEQPATVAVAVFYQPIGSPVRLTAVHLEDLFASFYPTYKDEPFGTVQLVNDSPDSVTATLSFFLPDYMRRPSEQPLVLPPQSAPQVDLKAHLGPEVLNVQEAVSVEAEVSLSVQVGELITSVKKVEALTLYGHGALRWDDVRRAAAFITPADPAVSGFARPVLVDFEGQIKSLGKPCRNLLSAMVLFEALRAHGVRYVPDANRPYGKVRAEASAIDHISYPAEMLEKKAGDCDDLTALYASLLENAGVATALVDAPGHIFLLFDTGVSRQEVYKLPVEEKLYVVRGDRVWVPVEVTKVGEGFAAAWRAGAEEVAALGTRELREKVVDTAKAWEQYAAVSPAFEGKVVAPGKEVLQEGVGQQHAAVAGLIDAHLARHYLDPLKVSPGDGALWLELAKVYMGLQRYEAAIQSAYDRLIERGGQDAGLLNQLGIAYFLKGDVRQAAYSFQQAVGLAPEDKKMRGNLDKALAALGKGERLKGKPPAAAAAGSEELATEEVDDAKAGQVEMDEDSFYWGE